MRLVAVAEMLAGLGRQQMGRFQAKGAKSRSQLSLPLLADRKPFAVGVFQP
jgi:hypothetical protein